MKSKPVNVVKSVGKKVKNKVQDHWAKVAKRIRKYPLASFFVALAFLLMVLVLANFFGQPKTQETEVEKRVKKVRIYQIGSVPTVSLQAKVEKTGVVNVIAQTGGVVQKIHTFEGDRVYRGQSLMWLSQTYAGANAVSIQRQLAEKNYTHNKDTFDRQKELIEKQRELAERTDDNSDRLREITKDSLDETNDALHLNESILNAISENLTQLETATNSGENAELILTTKQLKAQSLAGVNQLKQAVRTIEYQKSGDNPPAALSNLGREITFKQLELQEKALDLSLEISELNLKLAQVAESLFYPQSPFAGTVERVHVKVGQLVQPGQVLATISGDETSVRAIALVSNEMAENISRLDLSTIYYDGTNVALKPTFVSSEPTNGSRFSLIYDLPGEVASKLNDREYVHVDVPIGYAESLGSNPYVPLDSVYQTQDEAYVFLDEQGLVVSREVELGEVYGSFIQVLEGINDGDRVILDRNVVSGDLVEEG